MKPNTYQRPLISRWLPPSDHLRPIERRLSMLHTGSNAERWRVSKQVLTRTFCERLAVQRVVVKYLSDVASKRGLAMLADELCHAESKRRSCIRMRSLPSTYRGLVRTRKLSMGAGPASRKGGQCSLTRKLSPLDVENTNFQSP